MQVKVVLILLLIASFSTWEGAAEIDERLKEDFYKIYSHVAFEAREAVDEPVTPDKINYFLFTRENPQNYTEIDPKNPEELVNPNVKIVFIIHGWTENRNASWYENLKNAFLNRSDAEYYVVQVDWSDPANQFYTISSYNTKDVGHFIGEFVVNLHKNYSIPLENFVIVGHSLGGQVSGFIGKTVQKLQNRKLPIIIALDPAGPLFSTLPEEKRLNRNDAEVVQVIHTDGGTFGYRASCGTIDFFPNGGNFQPGCLRPNITTFKAVIEPIMCDHHRSWQYYIEAVGNPDTFMATKCRTFANYKAGICKEEKTTMGNLNVTFKGDFYLGTNSKEPYAEEKTGDDRGGVGESVKKALFAVSPLGYFGL